MIKENFQQALRPKSPLMRSGERESLTDNGSYRRAVLDRYIFRNLSEVRELTGAWRKDYNEERPYEALDNMTSF
jgi:transposase InsO family protein